jgi:hypothetical protein
MRSPHYPFGEPDHVVQMPPEHDAAEVKEELVQDAV